MEKSRGCIGNFIKTVYLVNYIEINISKASFSRKKKNNVLVCLSGDFSFYEIKAKFS